MCVCVCVCVCARTCVCVCVKSHWVRSLVIDWEDGRSKNDSLKRVDCYQVILETYMQYQKEEGGRGGREGGRMKDATI